jgi:hypothetical protein
MTVETELRTQLRKTLEGFDLASADTDFQRGYHAANVETAASFAPDLISRRELVSIPVPSATGPVYETVFLGS